MIKNEITIHIKKEQETNNEDIKINEKKVERVLVNIWAIFCDTKEIKFEKRPLAFKAIFSGRNRFILFWKEKIPFLEKILRCI